MANPNEHIVEKTRKIQEDFVQVLKREDGTSKNIKLIDKSNIHNNFLQSMPIMRPLWAQEEQTGKAWASPCALL